MPATISFPHALLRRAARPLTLLGCVSLLGVAAPAVANMGNTATTYGILPMDIASAQALSMFNTQVSATYYNPAYLARDSRGELTGGLFHAEHELRVKSRGGANPPTRSGDVLSDTPSQQVLIGMKTDLSSLTKFDKPMYLGFMAGVEKYGEEMLAFTSETSEEGQFFNYGRQPLFLNVGGGMNLWRGIDVGASLRVTLHADATMRTRSNLAGDTSQESLNVKAKPVMRPIIGINVRWGDTFCDQSPCWMDAIETALVYKGYSNSRTKVSANAVIPGTIAPPGLDLAIQTLDSFQPEIITAGLLYHWGKARIGLTAEWQRWSRLEEEFERDTLKDQAMMSFKDIVIPRVGVEYQVNDLFSITTGVAFEKSPLEGRESLDVNYFDNDRYVIGLGGSLEIKNPPILAHPMRLDFGYQYHHLRERSFNLSHSTAPTNPYETVNTDGEVHVFAGSVTMKF